MFAYFFSVAHVIHCTVRRMVVTVDISYTNLFVFSYVHLLHMLHFIIFVSFFVFIFTVNTDYQYQSPTTSSLDYHSV